MTISRYGTVLSMLLVLALAGCGGPQASQVESATATLKQIIDSGVQNPELSELVNRRLDLLNTDASRLERELRSDASEVVMSPDGCGTWLIVGQRQKDVLGRDNSVRAQISLCPNDPARLRKTTVTFGAP